MKLNLKSGACFILLAAVGCGGLSNEPNPRINVSKAAKGGAPAPAAPAAPTAPATGGGGGGGGGAVGGGGGGGGGGAPAPADAAAQALRNTSSAIGTPDIDFGSLLNNVGGAVRVGASRTAQEMVVNTSKKTALTITSISIVGANASDFAVDAASVSRALEGAIAANKSAFAMLPVTFAPTDAGPRVATLQIVSNAGTAVANLSGTGAPLTPVLGALPALTFLPDSAFDTLTVENFGGPALALQSIAITGANPEAFQFFAANSGQGNCFAGVLIATDSFCFIGVGVAAGAAGPASATLTILSNDPATPETDIPLTLNAAAATAPTPVP